MLLAPGLNSSNAMDVVSWSAVWFGDEDEYPCHYGYGKESPVMDASAITLLDFGCLTERRGRI